MPHSYAEGACLIDPNVDQPQRIWLARSSILDGRQEAKHRIAHEQLHLIFADSDGLHAASPAQLLNSAAPETAIACPNLPDRAPEEIQIWAYEHLTEKQEEQVRSHRQNECDLRLAYLETTFTQLILELQDKLNESQHAQLFGNENLEETQQLTNHINHLKLRKQQRLDELALMSRLSANLPELVTSAIIVPAPTTVTRPGQGIPMRRDDEVEQIAMGVVMEYERKRGWKPVDVSQEGEHYDIRSESPTGEKRFIEVKGRAQSGTLILTGPERDKLDQLGARAFLYIVTHCRSEQPCLRMIQNPIPQLSPEMFYRQVQFLVSETDWAEKGEEAVIDA